ncbi:MAG: aldose 1-epimerase family protein [Planctomycetaceae bacterium]|jgi:galactose mutarotase-like enzyme|nr:aldose 1-epimerase family protein [Planctomycetaceae bacterium]
MTNRFTLIDTDNEIYRDKFEFQSVGQRDGVRPARYSMKRLRGGVSDGVDVVTIDNGLISMDILPTRGCSIYKVRCGDVELKWDSPNMRPVHPSLVPLFEPNGLGWLDGFTEWFVRCGLESNGSPDFDANGKLLYPLHGRIANIPADYVEICEETNKKEICFTGKIFETKLFFKKFELRTNLITHFNSPKFTVRDTITNLSAELKEFELLYHVNTGQPFASPEGRVVVPFDRLVPRTDVAAENLPEWDKLGPEITGSDEVVFYFEPAIDTNGICKTMLINAAGNRAVVLSFKRDSFPYFALWKSRLANADGYVCGLEPAINFPNTRTFEKQQGRIAKLNPQESRTFELNFEILDNSEAVHKTESEIKNFKTKGKIEPKPIKEWSQIN